MGQTCLGYHCVQVCSMSLSFSIGSYLEHILLMENARDAREKANHASPLQASVVFTPSKVIHVSKHTGSGGSIPSTVGRHYKVTRLRGKWSAGTIPLQASEESDQRFLSSFGIQDIVLMGIFCLLHWLFLLNCFCGSFYPQAFNTVDSQGSFLCILFSMLVFLCSSHCGLMAINTEDTHISISTSSEVQMHISFRMPYRHLKLSMHVPVLSPQPSLFQ